MITTRNTQLMSDRKLPIEIYSLDLLTIIALENYDKRIVSKNGIKMEYWHSYGK